MESMGPMVPMGPMGAKAEGRGAHGAHRTHRTHGTHGGYGTQVDEWRARGRRAHGAHGTHRSHGVHGSQANGRRRTTGNGLRADGRTTGTLIRTIILANSFGIFAFDTSCRKLVLSGRRVGPWPIVYQIFWAPQERHSCMGTTKRSQHTLHWIIIAPPWTWGIRFSQQMIDLLGGCIFWKCILPEGRSKELPK